MIQNNTAYAFLDYYTEAEGDILQILHNNNMGNFGGYFGLIAWWGAREVLDLVGELGSENECSRLPQGWNVVNKDILPALVIGSYTMVLRGQALVCSLTVLANSVTMSLYNIAFIHSHR